jgi:hypothetical protein
VRRARNSDVKGVLEGALDSGIERVPVGACAEPARYMLPTYVGVSSRVLALFLAWLLWTRLIIG